MATLALRELTKRYPGHVALESLSLAVEEGEFLIVVGPSGCGKSTALRLIAGLDKPTSGDIVIGNQVVNDLPPMNRDIAMVFQNYALYPHMTVHRNLAYGLKQRRMPKSEIDKRVREISGMLELDPLLGRKPGQLSGGQRQRVAMGRALVRNPQVFLLDEPLSNLDAKLRGEVRAELKRLHHRAPVTSVYVTHDQVEAMTLGDRIAVMNQGKLQQLGTPDEIFDRPTNTFVAGFVGTPPMNLLPGQAVDGRLRVGSLELPLSVPAGGEVTVGIRPEHLEPAQADQPALDAYVDVVENLGSEVVVHASVESQAGRSTLVGRLQSHQRPAERSTVRLTVNPRLVHVFAGPTGAAVRAS